MPKLYVLSGPDIGKSFEVGAGALIGRGADCAVHLRDTSVSRAHARFDFAEGRWRVVDLASRNGLVRAGARVREVALDDGAEFQVGEVLLRFRAEVAGSAAPLQETSRPGEADPTARAPLVAPTRGSKRDLEDEIVLEGEWNASSVPPAAPSKRADLDVTATTIAPRPPAPEPAQTGPEPRLPRARVPVASAPTASTPTTGAPSAGAPSASAPVLTRPMDSTLTARGAGSASRGILQYRREPDRPGFFNADLAQQPLWVRAGVWVLALACFAGLFWLAYRGTAYLKSRAQVEPAPIENETR